MDHWNLCVCKGSEADAEDDDWELFVIDTSNTEAAMAASDTYVRYGFCMLICTLLSSNHLVRFMCNKCALALQEGGQKSISRQHPKGTGVKSILDQSLVYQPIR